ncbi:tryptophan 7-halogenase [Citromicrobium bathyomarinum]|uniref:tryptophan 7-halogenase n=1 Tax=Citromicrobium bathyomarinum TaxID=72174 RepID=UPI00315A0C20
MDHNARRPIASAAIFGNGAVALCAAIAIKRAVQQCSVRVIEPVDGGTTLADSFPVIYPPALPMLHALGLDEVGLVRSGLASHRIADRFAGWHGDPFMIPVEEHEPPVSGVPFGPIARLHSGEADPSVFSPALAFAQAGRFRPEGADGVGYALRLDPDRFARALRTLSERAGVTFAKADGAAIDADLCIDCGPPIESADAPQFEDWGTSIPGHHLLHWQAEGVVSLVDDHAAFDWGWKAEICGPGRRHHIAVSNDTSAIPDAPSSAIKIQFTPGRLASPWARNRIALGDAAAVPGPLGHFGFTLALLHLGLLLELMPGAEPDPLLEREYNRRAAILSDEVRDFVALLHAGAQHRGAFWQQARALVTTPPLASIIARFTRTGRTPVREAEIVSDAAWAHALAALFDAAPGFDALARSVPADQAAAALSHRAEDVRRLVASQPRYEEWIGRITRR